MARRRAAAGNSRHIDLTSSGLSSCTLRLIKLLLLLRDAISEPIRDQKIQRTVLEIKLLVSPGLASGLLER